MSYLREKLRKIGAFLVSLDIYLPYLKDDKERNTYDEFTLADACSLPFRDKSFDLVLALDLLEHIPKEKGIKLLNDLERIACKRLVLSLPIGWHPSRDQANPYNTHISSYSYGELKVRNYEIETFYIRLTGVELFEDRLPAYLRPLYLLVKVAAGIITAISKPCWHDGSL